MNNEVSCLQTLSDLPIIAHLSSFVEERVHKVPQAVVRSLHIVGNYSTTNRHLPLARNTDFSYRVLDLNIFSAPTIRDHNKWPEKRVIRAVITTVGAEKILPALATSPKYLQWLEKTVPRPVIIMVDAGIILQRTCNKPEIPTVS